METTSGLIAITAEQLIEIIRTLPPGSTVLPNTAGNLIVSNADGEKFLGWIDLHFDEFVGNDQPDESVERLSK